MMPAEAPDMTARIGFQHSGGAASDLIHIVDLPGTVMEERHRSLLNEDIMVIWRTAKECCKAWHRVAQFEPKPVTEEALRPFLVDRPENDVPEPPRLDRPLAQDGGGPLVRAADATGTVVGDRFSRRLPYPRSDGNDDTDASRSLDGRDGPLVTVGCFAELVERMFYPIEVVRIVGADAELD